MNPHTCVSTALLLAMLASTCLAGECGVEGSFNVGSSVTVEFEKSFDLDEGFIFRNDAVKPVRISVKQGRTFVADRPLRVLSLALGEKYYFGGEHSGCTAKHAVKDGKPGLLVSAGAATPWGTKLRDVSYFIPAADRKRSKANQSLEPTRVGKPPLAAQLQR